MDIATTPHNKSRLTLSPNLPGMILDDVCYPSEVTSSASVTHWSVAVKTVNDMVTSPKDVCHWVTN